MARPIDNAPAAELDLDGLAIDRKADVPIGVQLTWVLRSRIAEGRFAAGQRLPGLRELAEATGVNVNTVRAVYQRLEQDGLIDRQQGSGTFLAAAPQRAAAVGTITANAAHEARETGVDPREVAAALYVGDTAEPAEAAEEQSEQARRRSLRGQIAAFERAIAELEADHPGVAPAPPRSRRGIGPVLLTVEELARVRTDLIRRLTVVQGAIDDHIEQRREGAPAKAPALEPRKAKARPADSPRKTPRARPTTRPAPASS
ncbi:MAG TPA: winged helix-turn-helix domain-containing protein [Solirubrobacteraceae bacterium]|nr:winged helix-turn-helix domain-containing protein [Solirubrobacteraceae bacterium]